MADEDGRKRPPTADGNGPAPLALVCIGVCAASFQSLPALFAGLVPDAGAAYLIAVREDGLDVATVMAALTRESAFSVTLAADGERLRADHAYVAAPDAIITIENGHIRTRPAAEPAGHRGAFDSLLISLAEQAHERTVAVLLRGLGSEGSAGVVAAKKFGGLLIAEQADNADFEAQGGSNPAAVADLHLPVDRIGAEIARYVRNLRPILREEEDEDGDDLETRVTQIATILRNVTSHDFHGYKRGTFIRRIRRRIQVLQIDGGIDAYIDRLRTDRDEVQHLFQDLLIGVTQFFRDPAEFQTLESELPRLFADKGADDHFRVWVLGCATGEEAYSIAILLREYMARLDHPPEVQIFATDLDARALNLARAGRYSDTIAAHIRPDRLERWFVREGDTYCVSKELREMCIFSPHNVLKDAPFSRIDILSCRNLLIYLNTELQNRVIPIFHFSLRSNAILFLGSSENVTRHQKLFAPVDRKSRVFRRLETAARIIPDFPLTPRARSGAPDAPHRSAAAFEGRLPPAVSRQAEAIAERHAPAYVVVDTQGDVLHFSGRTGRYLEPSAGTASLNLPNLVHRDLRLDVRSAIQRAIAEGRRIELPRLTYRQEDRTLGVAIVVEPLSSTDVTAMVVIFQDLGAVPGTGVDDERPSTDAHVQRLEAELRVTRDRLQATIEELESTNEELKSSNEEYQSINEELQSANEEMETSKEELQSVNEELQTVNGELAHRVSELGRTNSDLKNLLESTRIATVFLDNDMRIRNFTPAATDIFHLLDTDIGRPLDHVVSRVLYPELQDDVRQVLKTLVPVDRQVADESSIRHFAARVLPYRSVHNFINGAVVTFTDLTALLRVQAALHESEARLAAMFESLPVGVAVVNADGDFLLANAEMRRFTPTERMPSRDPERMWRWTAIDADGDRVPPADFPGARALRGLPTVPGLEMRYMDDADDPIWTNVSAVPIVDEAGRITGQVTVISDTTASKRSEQALRKSEERLSAFVTASSNAVYRMNPDWTEMQTLDGRGFMPDMTVPSRRWMDICVFPEDHARVRDAIDAAIRDRAMFMLEHRVWTVGGAMGWVHSRAVPVLGDDDAIVEWFGTATDITELHEATRALQEAEQRQQVLIEGVPQLVWRAVDGGAWTWASPQWVNYTGLPESASHGRGWLDPVSPEDRQRARAAWAEAAEQGGFDLEYRIRRAADGQYRWFRNRATPVRDRHGMIVEWLGTSTDVDEMRSLQKRQEVLVAELQHRVRNMLTVVRSVFSQTVESGERFEDVVDHFKGRLDALARTQVIVTRSAAGLVDLENLIRDELLSVGAAEGPKLRISGPDVTLASKTAESIGLAIHELTTNALKYGALKFPGASLDISWSIDLDQGSGNMLNLIWLEQGVPAVPTRPVREGFGRELIEEALPYRLGAETRLEFLGGGVRCLISAPLADSGEGIRSED